MWTIVISVLINLAITYLYSSAIERFIHRESYKAYKDNEQLSKRMLDVENRTAVIESKVNHLSEDE